MRVGVAENGEDTASWTYLSYIVSIFLIEGSQVGEGGGGGP
jgi:hypothetical protein